VTTTKLSAAEQRARREDRQSGCGC